MRNPFAPKTPTNDTTRAAAAEAERLRAQTEAAAKAARRQEVLDTQGCANREWDAANGRVAERRERVRRTYR